LLSEKPGEPRSAGSRTALRQGGCHAAQAGKSVLNFVSGAGGRDGYVTRSIKSEIAEVARNTFVIDEVCRLLMRCANLWLS
jgi:hypothetical protein